jgi:hypothetical protein
MIGPNLQARLKSTALDSTGPQKRQCDPVEQRRLMQLYERVCVVPMSPGRTSFSHESDVDVGVIEERIGECHSDRAGPNNEVIGLDC